MGKQNKVSERYAYSDRGSRYLKTHSLLLRVNRVAYQWITSFAPGIRGGITTRSKNTYSSNAGLSLELEGESNDSKGFQACY